MLFPLSVTLAILASMVRVLLIFFGMFVWVRIMAFDLKLAGLIGISLIALTFNSFGQQIDTELLQVNFVPKEKTYAPRKATQLELERYALIEDTEEKWIALFNDVTNAELHWEIAKNYIDLGSGDIALHELQRAITLGIEPKKVLADIGKSYLLRERYADIFNHILLEDAVPSDYGEIYMLYGQVHFLQNNMEEAFKNFYKANEFFKEGRLSLNKPLAELYNLMGEYVSAELNVDKALKFNAKDPDLFLIKGDLVHRRKGNEASHKYFQLADFYRPDDILIETKLAGALYNLKRFDEAFEVLSKILNKEKKHPYANLMMAFLSVEKNDIRAANYYLNQAGNVYDDFVPGLLLEAKISYGSGLYQQGITALERALEIEPENTQVRRLLGASFLQIGNYQNAVSTLNYLLDGDNLVKGDFLLLGNAHALVGSNTKATEFFKLASDTTSLAMSEENHSYKEKFDREEKFGVSLNIPGIINSNINSNQRLIIQTYKALKEGKYITAADLAAIIIDQNRKSPIGFNLLGLSYFSQNKIDEARGNFRKAIGIDRDYHPARLNLARLELSEGRQNTAISGLNKILSRDVNYIPAYELLFENAKYEGDIILAEEYLLIAVNNNPRNVSIRKKLFDFYFSEEKIDKAKNLAVDMVKNYPMHPSGYKALGSVNLIQLNFIAGVGNLEKALELFNGDEEIYKLLSRAYALNKQLIRARVILKDGLTHVSNILSLQRELINFVKVDNDFVSGHHFANQLKLNERTKAEGYMLQGNLFLMENKMSEAINAYQSAAKSGASQEAVLIGLKNAHLLKVSASQRVVKIFHEN